MKRLVVLVLVSLVISFFVAPTLAFSGEPKYGGTLVYATESDWKQFDPHKSMAVVEGVCLRLVFEQLVAHDKDLKIQPSLAESWEVSDDGLVWTFYLRKGVKFHNGREFVADDVKFSFDRVMDPKTGSALAVDYAKIDRVEVVDQYTVKFILKKPFAGFLTFQDHLNHYGFVIIAKECVDAENNVTHPIGTGPFEFVEWKTNDYGKFRKHKDYWVKGLPYLDEVIIKPIPDTVVRMTALKAGDIDAARLLPLDESAEILKNPSPDYQLKIVPGGGVCTDIMFNVSKPPFNDIRVRQAVALAINKKEIETGTSFGLGQVTNQPYVKGTTWHLGVPDWVQDVDKAKALLAEAGYPNGLEVVNTVTNAYPEMVNSSLIIQDQLRQIGIKVIMNVLDWPTTIKQYVSRDWTMGVCGFCSGPDPDQFYRAVYYTNAPYGILTGGYSNPEVDRLLDEATSEMDLEKRKAIYAKAVALIQSDAPQIMLDQFPNAIGWRADVKGYDPPFGVLVFPGGGLQYTWLDR